MKGTVVDGVALVMAAGDTVATALGDLDAGQTIERPDGPTIELVDDVPFGHKLAVAAMDEAGAVRKYGEVIGTAETRIEPGTWVHTHNCRSARGRGDLTADIRDGEHP